MRPLFNPAFAPPGLSMQGAPLFGRPSFPRFREAMDERGVQYAADAFTYSVASGALVAGATVSRPINIEHMTMFEWVATTASIIGLGGGGFTDPWADVTVNISSSDSQRSLMSQPTAIANIAGNAGYPLILPVSRRFMPATQVNIVMTNQSGTDITDVEIALLGRKWFMQSDAGFTSSRIMPNRFRSWTDETTGKTLSEDIYFLDFFAESIASTASLDISNLIPNDGDFEWIMTTASGTGFTAPAATFETASFMPGIQVMVRDGGSQRNLFNRACYISDIAGNGEFPLVNPQPRIFVRNTPVIVTLTNGSGSTLTDTHFTMIGRKITEQD